MSQIEDLIVQGSDDFFDEPSLRLNLHVSIRIALDFHDFLLRAGDPPSSKEAAYVMDTIRSGIDEFFALAYSCRAINTSADAWDAHDLPRNFSALQEAFVRRFEDLVRPTASAVERLAALLVMMQLELAFLAQNFPRTLIS